MGKVVVFYHPGGEVLTQNVPNCGWTVKKHGRKYMLTSGRILDSNCAHPIETKELYFWGEYEAPTSRLQLCAQSSRQLPQYLHTLTLPVPPSPRRGVHLNTDPFVFCDDFVFSNCQQVGTGGVKRNVQNLQRDDIILFGSRLDNNFVLDTVFVVDNATPLNQFIGTWLFQSITSRLIAQQCLYTAFQGRSWNQNLPYCFVPCWSHNGKNQCGNSRPIISPIGALAGIINVRQGRGINGVNRVLSSAQVHAAWLEVVNQVFSQGCQLGVEVNHPLCCNASAVVPKK